MSLKLSHFGYARTAIYSDGHLVHFSFLQEIRSQFLKNRFKNIIKSPD